LADDNNSDVVQRNSGFSRQSTLVFTDNSNTNNSGVNTNSSNAIVVEEINMEKIVIDDFNVDKEESISFDIFDHDLEEETKKEVSK